MKPKALTPAILAFAAITCAPLASASLITYIPGASVLQTWDFTGSAVPGDLGWSSERTITPTAGGIQLGSMTPAEGQSREGFMWNTASGLGSANCGVEMTFTGTNGFYGDNASFLRMYNGTEAVGLGAVGGNIFLSGWGGDFNPPSWSVSASALFDGTQHSLALVLFDDRTLSAYLDGTLLDSRTVASLPTSALTSVGVGNQISGGWYIPAGTVVSEVTAFNLTAIPEPGSLLALGGLLGSGLCLRSRRR